MMGESSTFTFCKEIRVFFVNLDRFSKYLKYMRNFEKQSKLTKNSDFFAKVNVLLSPIILSQVRLFSDYYID